MQDVGTSHLDAFLQQRAFCDGAGATITGLIAEACGRAVDLQTRTGRLVIGWPGDRSVDAVPLRLIGGLRALTFEQSDDALATLFAGQVRDLPGAIAIVRQALHAHDLALLPWLDMPPQTNEIGRSAALMAGMLNVVEPDASVSVEVLEIGSSAGLNLLIDRLGFDFGGTRFGPADAPFWLQPQWRGPPPHKAQIAFRPRPRGVDRMPIDVRDDAAVIRLRAYVWVDAAHRLARLEAGIALARQCGVLLDRADAADWLESRLDASQEPQTLRVLMHSAVWKYLGPERQARITSAMTRAGARATSERPLAWVSVEPEASTASTWVAVRRWPERPEPRRVARVDLHGDWIEPLPFGS